MKLTIKIDEYELSEEISGREAYSIVEEMFDDVVFMYENKNEKCMKNCLNCENYSNAAVYCDINDMDYVDAFNKPMGSLNPKTFSCSNFQRR